MNAKNSGGRVRCKSFDLQKVLNTPHVTTWVVYYKRVILEKLVLIEHKFLETGHTQMECDSIHAQIEKAKPKNESIE
ncbi:hypothetical protein B566_EDAN014348, partial [Ephemera danica]